MLFDRGKVKVFVYINYGRDEIRHECLKVSPEDSVLDVLKKVAQVEFSEDESATDHDGAMVCFIDGFANDLEHCWIYYVFERGESGWRLPFEMPDCLKVSDGMRIGWRYIERSGIGERPLDGPLWTTRCVSKTRTCSRKF